MSTIQFGRSFSHSMIDDAIVSLRAQIAKLRSSVLILCCSTKKESSPRIPPTELGDAFIHWLQAAGPSGFLDIPNAVGGLFICRLSTRNHR